MLATIFPLQFYFKTCPCKEQMCYVCMQVPFLFRRYKMYTNKDSLHALDLSSSITISNLSSSITISNFNWQLLGIEFEGTSALGK